MKRFTDAGRRAIADGNLYAGLSIALMLPDICGALQNPNKNSHVRYVRWCKKWLVPKFPISGVTKKPFISAEECFQLRCSVVHAGSFEIDPDQIEVIHQFEFCDSTVGSHMNFGHDLAPHKGVPVPNYVQLKVDLFSEDVFSAAEAWDAANVGEKHIQERKAHLLVIRSSGFQIGGQRFG